MEHNKSTEIVDCCEDAADWQTIASTIAQLTGGLVGVDLSVFSHYVSDSKIARDVRIDIEAGTFHLEGFQYLFTLPRKVRNARRPFERQTQRSKSDI